jgi:GNAT superfamily N-acetyltransferase
MSATTTHHANPTGGTPPFAAAELEGTHWIEHLRDRTPVLIRPLQPEDREREEAFVRALSPEARRLRFMSTFKEASPALIDQLMEVDGEGRMAFVALAHENGRLREVGVSRYSACTDRNRCECAVTVAEGWRQRGLGALLMRHLIDAARQHGFREMVSVDLADNEPMRELARYLGFERTIDAGDASLAIHTLALRGARRATP